MSSAPAQLGNLTHRPHNPAAVTGVLNRVSTRVELHKTFTKLVGINADIQNAAEATRMIVDPEFELLGTNASSDDCTFNAEGGLKFQTDGADNDQCIVLPHLDASQSAWTGWTWGTDKQVEWDCVLATGSAITLETIWAGLKLTNTSVVATDNDQAFFRFSASGNWIAVYSIGGVDVSYDTGIAVAASTIYRLRIWIDSNRYAHFYINDEEVKVTAALTDAVDLIPYVGIQANEAAAKDFTLYEQSISRVRG